ncbi:NAD(P)-binding protein [Lentinula aciculospora]|uniref:NAD(P)-binding protein n=1 Tax=Lentinula aciculospora TaxID=153920 RepID=A0A9W9AE26_9AGAR|nr:NAD(P)-binding protein [Lentinula aciculospora]
MKLAVTGCNGEVGKRVVKLALQRGHNVVGVDLADGPLMNDLLTTQEASNFAYLQVDLTNYEASLAAIRGCEGIVHLAARRDPGDYVVATHNTNVVVSWNVLRGAAELGINRIAQASSVNIITMVYSKKCDFKYFPIDEAHPRLPDEPYGLSKLICEMQADTLVRRYPMMRIASLRLHWSIPDPTPASSKDPGGRIKQDLWGYVQEDSAADAFLRAVVEENGKWSGHEAFFIASPRHAYWNGKSRYCPIDSRELREKYWPEVPIKDGFDVSGSNGFFDCSKAERLLDWVHTDK